MKEIIFLNPLFMNKEIETQEVSTYSRQMEDPEFEWLVDSRVCFLNITQQGAQQFIWNYLSLKNHQSCSQRLAVPFTDTVIEQCLKTHGNIKYCLANFISGFYVAESVSFFDTVYILSLDFICFCCGGNFPNQETTLEAYLGRLNLDNKLNCFFQTTVSCFLWFQNSNCQIQGIVSQMVLSDGVTAFSNMLSHLTNISTEI